MEEEIENLIEELIKVTPEMLSKKGLKLFNTIMAILDEMDKLRNENAEIKKKDKIIALMAEQLTTPIHSKEWVIEYYTKKVEEE